MAADDDNDGWATDEDGAICKLKGDGRTWAEIGASLRRSKSAVRRRFATIRAQVAAAGHDTTDIGEHWAADMRRRGREIPSPERPSPPKADRDGGGGGGGGREGDAEEEAEVDMMGMDVMGMMDVETVAPLSLPVPSPPPPPLATPPQPSPFSPDGLARALCTLLPPGADEPS